VRIKKAIARQLQNVTGFDASKREKKLGTVEVVGLAE
jgi:hypothetical protein